jgi:hypothetical protein
MNHTELRLAVSSGVRGINFIALAASPVTQGSRKLGWSASQSVESEEQEYAMPQLEWCVYCDQPIKPEDPSIEVDTAPQDPRDFGKPISQQYAHLKCSEQMAQIARNGL